MSMRKRIWFLFLALALLMFVNACVPAVNMKRDELTKGDMTRGSVVIGTVLNKRTADDGGNSFEIMGKLRGGYGNPFTLKAEHGRDIDIVLKEVAKAALEHTGYSTEQSAGKSYRLDIDLLKFWCDGYAGYKIEADIAVKLVNAVNGNLLVQKDINVQKGFTILASYNPMHEAFNEVVNNIQKELVAFMQSQEFRKAVK
jgi:hypothetical protein